VTFALLGLLLLLQPDPQIEKIERLVGNVNRRYLWAPLSVTLSSRSGWKGDLLAHSSMGFDVARSVEVPPSGRISVLLPAVDPEEVSAGAGVRERLSRELSTPDFVVGVDARLPFAAELASSDRVYFQKLELETLRKLLPLGLLEAFDLLLLADSSGLSTGAAGAWRVVPTRGEAEEAVRVLLRRAVQVELVDDKIWELGPQSGGAPAKKNWLVLWAVLYAFCSFGSLVGLGRWRARTIPGAALTLGGVFALLYFAFFPRGPLFILEHRAELIPAVGESREWRIWFVESDADLSTQIDFPSPVKPVLPTAYPPDRPFTIRMGERGCRVEGLALRAGVPVCFAASGGRAPSMHGVPRLSAPLYGAWLRRGEVLERTGDLAAGTDVAALGHGSRPTQPLGTEAEVLGRLAPGDVVMGWAELKDSPAEDVASRDLAQARRRPRWILGCLK
jgi:hypothetical protein